MVYFDGATVLSPTHLGTVAKGQDGAIYNNCLFRFSSKGLCRVYDLHTLALLGEFTLDKAEILCPHSNSVCFGDSDGEDFPILYTNIYNNYAAAADRLEGVCCAYRITRNGNDFQSRLVQVIRIGFVDTPLWRSENGGDARPYGNFAVDGKTLWTFVMRDESRTTRFFGFPIPPITEGTMDPQWGVPVVTLTEKDILERFDGDYVNYIQGAICHNGFIYSVEGFTVPNQQNAIPALRIFDTKTQKQVLRLELVALGLTNEPEFVEVYQDRLYYADHNGDVYRFIFGKE